MKVHILLRLYIHIICRATGLYLQREKVAIKVVRAVSSNKHSLRVSQRFMKECAIWKEVWKSDRGEHVLPFYGWVAVIPIDWSFQLILTCIMKFLPGWWPFPVGSFRSPWNCGLPLPLVTWSALGRSVPLMLSISCIILLFLICRKMAQSWPMSRTMTGRSTIWNLWSHPLPTIRSVLIWS